MKRFLAVIISLIFALTLVLSGCGEIDRDKELKDIQKTTENGLEDTFAEETCDFELLLEYIESWAKNADIEIADKTKHSIILKNPATKGHESDESTSLICSVDPDQIQTQIKVISTATTALMGPTKHGSITLAISETKNGRMLGMENLDYSKIKSDNLIQLQPSTSNTILTSGADNASCIFTAAANTKQSHYAKAYEITMSMAKYTDPYNFVKGSNYPNPINVIGGLLATAKSSGRLFDIASFTYEGKTGYTPYSATAVVVIDDNNVESFIKKFDKSYENMEEKFEKLEDNFVYTMTETDMPETVLRDKVSNHIISLMYTLNTGICNQDEESGIVYSTSYIKSISTSDDEFKLLIDVRARGEENLNDLTSEYEVTSGLCNTDFACKKGSKIWSAAKGSTLVDFFTEAVPLNEAEESDISLKTYETDLVAKELSRQNMIIYTFDKGDRTDAVLNITHFIEEN